MAGQKLWISVSGVVNSDLKLTSFSLLALLHSLTLVSLNVLDFNLNPLSQRCTTFLGQGLQHTIF